MPKPPIKIGIVTPAVLRGFVNLGHPYIVKLLFKSRLTVRDIIASRSMTLLPMLTTKAFIAAAPFHSQCYATTLVVDIEHPHRHVLMHAHPLRQATR